ncbi:hypothetical protein Bbelb_303130 [Branchiostoma belcheri]|nr:hypothetical protein Bbelb_303130 [Branchiostoma belcheri]
MSMILTIPYYSICSVWASHNVQSSEMREVSCQLPNARPGVEKSSKNRKHQIDSFTGNNSITDNTEISSISMMKFGPIIVQDHARSQGEFGGVGRTPPQG